MERKSLSEELEDSAEERLERKEAAELNDDASDADGYDCTDLEES
jgi:hypothetical protein